MVDAPENLNQLTPEQQAELQEKLKNMSPEELMEFQKQQCIFCQIISGKVPSKKLYEDDICLIILDINPAARGHLLILPKDHYAIMPQIPEKVIGHMFKVAKKYSKVLLKGLKADGTSIFVANGLVAGQKAQHFMLHIIPRKEDDGLMVLEEISLDSPEAKSASITIGNRLNEMLGVKKEVVDTGQKVVDAEFTEEVEDEQAEGLDDDSDEDESEDEFNNEDGDDDANEDSEQEDGDQDDEDDEEDVVDDHEDLDDDHKDSKQANDDEETRLIKKKLVKKKSAKKKPAKKHTKNPVTKKHPKKPVKHTKNPVKHAKKLVKRHTAKTTTKHTKNPVKHAKKPTIKKKDRRKEEVSLDEIADLFR